jgi:hypothetical protein
MGHHRFNPWIFAGDLVVANMQIGAVLNEKIAAASSGVFEAQKAALRLSRDVTLGKVSPERVAHAAAELGAAASKPALKAVKANAKRLSKRSPRK